MRGDLHRILVGVVALVGGLAVVAMALLWPGAQAGPAQEQSVFGAGQREEVRDAVLLDVREVEDDDLEGLLPGAVVVEIDARLEDSGETVTFEMTDDTGETFAPGQAVRLQVVEDPGQPTTYFISDFRRERPLVLLGVMFVGAVLAFGRWQGLRALMGLGLSLAVIVGFIIPGILGGRSPVAVALVGAVVIMIVTLYLSHGYARKTTAAVVGTTLALGFTGLLAVAFVSATNLTGFTSEEARLANFEVGGLSLRGLLLAGIIIGGLGVLDDVTMSQASTVFELHRANPRARFSDLLRGALNVGRDHIAATVNTLFLAYAGAALPLLILFSIGSEPIATILTAEIVAVEIVRTLVGSIGLIAAVPLTTALAAAVVVADPAAADREAVLGDGHGHHHGRAGDPAAPEPAAANGGAEPVAMDGGEPAASADLGARPRESGEPPPPPPPPPEEDAEWVDRLRSAYGISGRREPPGRDDA